MSFRAFYVFGKAEKRIPYALNKMADTFRNESQLRKVEQSFSQYCKEYLLKEEDVLSNSTDMEHAFCVFLRLQPGLQYFYMYYQNRQGTTTKTLNEIAYLYGNEVINTYHSLFELMARAD